MALVKTFTAEELREEFRKFDRDYYSLEGYQALLDLFDECGSNTELDVVAICCEFTEDSMENIMDEYSNIFDDEWREENTDDDGEIDRQAFEDKLSYYTLSYTLSDGDYLYQDF